MLGRRLVGVREETERYRRIRGRRTPIRLRGS